MYVAIEGCIASGKSSTAVLLAERIGFAQVKEQTAQHPFIAQFYADPERFAFETELAFALIHYHQLHQLRRADIVADFSPAKDIIFAEMNLAGEELEMFMSLYDMLSGRVPQPDVAIFLDLPAEECQRRCIARGRPFEAGIRIEYLERLRKQYLNGLERLGTKVRVLKVHPKDSQDEVATSVKRLLQEVTP
ncbi:MAG: deoxynucleoside kinase [Actinobacteria bacterium]|nr:deoxynucleoside kinase [Actinomycetota bacterium]